MSKRIRTRKGTVKVKGFTRSDGIRVKAHKRQIKSTYQIHGKRGRIKDVQNIHRSIRSDEARTSKHVARVYHRTPNKGHKLDYANLRARDVDRLGARKNVVLRRDMLPRNRPHLPRRRR